ncbi:MFS transporter [Kutzneria sp. 744]|uniref:MFS transporter n=1 Tax=Kutzneria sp. (strain 744) TaxID=345341 RepID=UPI000A058B6B|nr:MFS transporter [Kutzneria sp. 744]
MAAPVKALDATPARVGYPIMLLAFGTSMVGVGIGSYGLPLFVLTTTGSATLTGWIAAAALVGSLLTGGLMGPLIDRVGMRRAWIFSLAGGSTTAALTVALFAAGLLPPWLLVSLSFVRSCVESPGRVAIFGMIPAVAEASGRNLARANGTVRAMNGVSNLASPIAAGIIAAVLGSVFTILADAVCALLALTVALVFLRRPTMTTIDEVNATRPRRRSYQREFREAIRYFWSDRLLRTLICFTVFFAALDAAIANIGLTLYAQQVLGSVTWYGVLVSCFGLGSLAGTVGYSVFGHRAPPRGLYLSAYLGFALVVLLLSVNDHTAVALGLMVVAGVLTSPIDLLYLAALQERVPERMFGRVTSVATTVISGPGPVAVALVTWLITGVGAHAAFALIGGCYLVVAVSLLFVRSLHQLRPPKPVTTTAEVSS